MFLDKISPATKRTAGRFAAASGAGLILFNELGGARPGDLQRFVLPALLVGGGVLLVQTSAQMPTQHVVSGAQEDADRARWQAEEKKAKLVPWIVGGAAVLVGTLWYLNR